MLADASTLATIRRVAGEAVGGKAGLLEQCLVTPINSLTLYQLEVCLVRAGPVLLLLEMMTSSTFLAGADLATRKAAYLALLRLLKFLLRVVGHSLLFMIVEALKPTSSYCTVPRLDSCSLYPFILPLPP